MYNLLSANFARLRKSRAFYVAVAAMLLYALFVVGTCWRAFLSGQPFEAGMEDLLLFAFATARVIPTPAFMTAPLVSLFLGTEFSDGALRNKLIAGRTRTEIYFANLLTCMGAALLLAMVYIVLTFAAGMPVLKGFRIPIPQVLALLGAGLLALCAYGSVLNMAAMLMGNKANTAILTLTAAVVVTVFLGITLERLDAPEFTAIYDITGRYIEERIPNPAYIRPPARAGYEFLLDLFPTGQCLRLSVQEVEKLWRLPLLSLAVIAGSSAVGAGCFCRKDIR